ncbi:hypothetical protein [Shewanella sp.]|uniref:hypothetical protein n=1 Tax=Shewanella sp. TaxID=50422 RepID=UPI003564D305
MTVIAVPELERPQIKSHHKPRHLKKLALGPWAETCIEFRFEADEEKFEQLDEVLASQELENGWDLLIAFYNERYHVSVSFFSGQGSVADVANSVAESIRKVFGDLPLTIYAGDANYGDWDTTYVD